MTSEYQASRPIHVVAAAVTDAEGRVLIAQRPPGKHLAGNWEFPGGKVEPGEPRVKALARELEEELGIMMIGQPRPLIRVRHAYPMGDVLIDTWVVTRYSGEPRGLDGQALRWCAQGELGMAELLPADKPIVAALQLPERLVSATSAVYSVTGPRDANRYDGLRGILCSNSEEARAAVSCAVADFLVMGSVIPDEDLSRLCCWAPLPVYARGTCLEHAWALGATGLNELQRADC